MPPRPGDVLYGDFWPEPVRVLTVQEIGTRTKIEAVGVNTRQFYENIFNPQDLSNVRVRSEAFRDFGGNGEAFFLAMEAHRIRYAQQFDPIFAVNVSQVDPLPHQIEAVYHYILRNPRIRFLLADDPGAGKTIIDQIDCVLAKHYGFTDEELNFNINYDIKYRMGLGGMNDEDSDE